MPARGRAARVGVEELYRAGPGQMGAAVGLALQAVSDN